MRLFLLTTLAMVAFAANSVLNRAALADGLIGPSAFAALRLTAGATILWAIIALRRAGGPEPLRWPSVLGLVLYMFGFSFAYVSLEAGVGALILFGGVQITMFAGAVLSGERTPASHWIGAVIAFGGLMILLRPGVTAPDPLGAVLMAASAVGWGVYSLMGRKATEPLKATGRNFLFAAPFGLLALVMLPDEIALTRTGMALAILSGAITSGLGYALWYAVLPKLPTTGAAVAQLTVPVIALGGGIVFLNEAFTLRFALAGALVVGGVGLSLARGQRSRVSRGS